jgi:hypothetical protein
MHHYLVLKNCVAGGERRTAGDIVQLPASEGNILISMGRVEQTSAPKAEPVVEDRAVGLTEDDAPKKRGRKAKDAPAAE